MTSLARARYRLQIAWDAYNVGLLSFDYSTFGGADVFGTSPLDVTFGGVYDDVSSRLNRADWSRGRDNPLATMLAGAATFELRDPGYMVGGVWHQGLYNPENPGSPIYGLMEGRLHPVRFEAIYPASYGLFAGWGRKFTWQPQGRRGVLQVECVDLFYWLDRARPVIVGTGPTTTGAAIGLILDAIGLTDAAMRDLDAGDAIPDFYADGTQTGLQLIEALLEAERGVFYIAGGGKATYRSWYARLAKTSSWTLANRMIDVQPAVDFDTAKTRVSVTRVDGLGVPLWYSVATAPDGIVGRIGLSDLPEIQTTYLATNAAADALAARILSQVETPRSPMYGLTIDNRESDLLTQIVSRELVDRITATESAGGTTGDYHIDRMDHSYSEGRHTASWLLSKASPVIPAVFDTATFDSGKTFV